VLVSSGGLGEEVNLLLRLLALPGAEFVLQLGCNNWVHDAGVNVAGWLDRVGVHTGRHVTEVWEGYGSLADAETRTAFLHTLRSVVDLGGQRVSAADRLYLAAEMPTLIMWGDHDRIIPVSQGHATHAAMPGSRLEIFEGAGHFPHCEDSARFCRVLVDFMQTTSPSTTSASEWRNRLLARST
jgi:pimeloyl-ACP methyl ester carboxylesterase